MLSSFKRANAQQVDGCRDEWRLAFEKSAHLICSLTPVSPLELTKDPEFLLLPSRTHTDLSQASCAVESSAGLGFHRATCLLGSTICTSFYLCGTSPEFFFFLMMYIMHTSVFSEGGSTGHFPQFFCLTCSIYILHPRSYQLLSAVQLSPPPSMCIWACVCVCETEIHLRLSSF